MDRTTQRTVSTVLALVGILAFIIPPSLLAPDIARFVGIGALVVSGGLYALPARKRDDGAGGSDRD